MKENEILFSAYSKRFSKISYLYIWDTNTKELKRISNNENCYDPFFSYDSTKIVYIKENIYKQGNIWIMDYNGINEKQITNSIYRDLEPSFSIDGKKIIFSRALELRESHMGGRRWYEWDIYEVDIDTLKVNKLTNKDYYSASYPYYFKSNKIIYSAYDSNLNRQMLSLNLDNNKLNVLIEKDVYSPFLSRDFNYLTFVGNDKIGKAIYLYNFTTESIFKVTNSNEYIYMLSPSITTKSNKIVFISDPHFKKKYFLNEINFDGSDWEILELK